MNHLKIFFGVQGKDFCMENISVFDESMICNEKTGDCLYMGYIGSSLVFNNDSSGKVNIGFIHLHRYHGIGSQNFS